MGEPRVGVIGGSGLYELEGLTDVRWHRVRTPFGDPSDAYCIGRLGDREVVFLPRHGRGHRLIPSELPFRANLYGMKALGVEWVISVSAVGSMREQIAPLDLVIPDLVPFADEILLGLGTLLLANFRKRKAPDVIEPRR